ncbi:MAG: helix-turn-helix domain-containing protein [Kiritimatiellae bacterium]|nr:helix-turn-helix domain-containing protein [Kiritimatiellia bacterium]
MSRYLAAIFHETPNPDGSVTVRPVTTARLVTVQQLAAHWHVSGQTVRNRVKDGSLRATYIGAQMRFSPEDILSYEAEHDSAEYEPLPRAWGEPAVPRKTAANPTPSLFPELEEDPE